MELHQLRALVFVAETGSVTEASRRLLLTQPAVTRQIRALEEELGGALFDRTTRPIAPTPLGKTALEQARRILKMSEEFRALISSDTGTLKGELRLGVSYSLARRIVPPVVLELRRQCPGVEIRLTTGWAGALKRALEEGLLDAAIGLFPPEWHIPAGLAATRLGPDPAACIASSQTKLKGKVRFEELREVGWVLNPEGCGYRAKLKRALEERGVPFRVVVEVPDPELQVQLIRAGVGAGLILKRALPPSLEKMGLRTFAIADLTFSLAAWLVRRPTGPVVPVAIPVIEKTASRLLTREGHRAVSRRAAP